ncbi:MAG: hypothetical protein BA863_06745 [Desulfovibrio sp. S3730MH75]|nr:MAG: hypothetical protein BA863_06745 [Desulfovibrio sp. S3730MH75]
MHVCPWWFAYSFDNGLRRLIDPVDEVLAKWVKPGMTVLDFGCGMGHYSIGAARLVGEGGKVIAVDLQDRMLEVMMRRADKAGVADIITPHKCSVHEIGYAGVVDFVVSSFVLHETPDLVVALQEIYSVLGEGGGFYLTEPRMHVKADYFANEMTTAAKLGFKVEVLAPAMLAYKAYMTK